jgi:hypothetical protein
MHVMALSVWIFPVMTSCTVFGRRDCVFWWWGRRGMFALWWKLALNVATWTWRNLLDFFVALVGPVGHVLPMRVIVLDWVRMSKGRCYEQLSLVVGEIAIVGGGVVAVASLSVGQWEEQHRAEFWGWQLSASSAWGAPCIHWVSFSMGGYWTKLACYFLILGCYCRRGYISSLKFSVTTVILRIITEKHSHHFWRNH